MRTYFKKTRKKYVDPLRGVGGNKHMKALRKRFKEVAETMQFVAKPKEVTAMTSDHKVYG